MELNISIIGAGNVGWHLAYNLYKKGYHILQIFSRSFENASVLAKNVNAEPINSLSKLNKSADIIIICVKDSAISKVVDKIKFQPKLLVHTAGSISMSILSKYKSHGVFYPLQSFSKTTELNIKTVPFCIEANTQANKKTLLAVATKLSGLIYEINSEQRLQCHIAAVFANNFANHMFAIAEQLLAKNDISPDIIKPLIIETAHKVQHTPALLAQTGPAIRNDKNTIKRHIELLQLPQLKKLYSFVSDSILNFKIGNLPLNNKNEQL